MSNSETPKTGGNKPKAEKTTVTTGGSDGSDGTSTSKKEEGDDREYTALEFAEIKGFDGANKFAVQRLYPGNQRKTLSAWVKLLKNDFDFQH